MSSVINWGLCSGLAAQGLLCRKRSAIGREHCVFSNSMVSGAITHRKKIVLIPIVDYFPDRIDLLLKAVCRWEKPSVRPIHLLIEFNGPRYIETHRKSDRFDPIFTYQPDRIDLLVKAVCRWRSQVSDQFLNIFWSNSMVLGIQKRIGRVMVWNTK